MTSWTTYSIGAPPNADNDVMAWAAVAASSPMPIKGNFKNWESIIRNYNRGNDEFSEQDLEKLAKGFKKSLSNVCYDWMLPRGKVNTCE